MSETPSWELPLRMTRPSSADDTFFDAGKKHTHPTRMSTAASTPFVSMAIMRRESFFTISLTNAARGNARLHPSLTVCVFTPIVLGTLKNYASRPHEKLFEGDDGHAALALAVLAGAETFDAGMAAEHLLHGGAQFARSVAVHDAHLLQVGDDGGV